MDTDPTPVPGDDAGPAAAWADGEDARWVREALALARAATERPLQDVPVGALVVAPDGTVLGRGGNVREERADPTGHAEVVALREAGARTGQWRLERCTLVVTLEPCAMCAGAAVLARVARIVFGAFDPKAGACGSVWDLPRDRQSLHRPEVVSGVAREECEQLLVDFFRRRRLG